MAAGALSPGSATRLAASPSEAEGPAGLPRDAPAGVVVGRIVRPFGRRGEVVVEPLTDDPGRFLELRAAEVGAPDGKGTRRSLESVRIHRGRPVVRFAGISDIDAAETLRDLEVRIGEAERPALPAGRYYLDELVGCRAESAEGEHLGEIVDTWDTAGPCLLVLRRPDGAEDLIPFVEALCVSVDAARGDAAGRVVLDLPDGLLGLNARPGR